MKKLLLLMCVLLTGVSGAWAQTTVKVAAYDEVSPWAASGAYITRSADNLTLTTTANSGFAGLTVVSNGTSSAGFWDKPASGYNWLLLDPGTTSEVTYTITINAPTGYIIKSYSIDCYRWNANRNYVVTDQDGSTKITINTNNAYNLSVSSLNDDSHNFTVKGEATATSGVYFAIKNMTVTLEPVNSVTVTYTCENLSGYALVTSTNRIIETGTKFTPPTISGYTLDGVYDDSDNEFDYANTNIDTDKTLKLKYHLTTNPLEVNSSTVAEPTWCTIRIGTGSGKEYLYPNESDVPFILFSGTSITYPIADKYLWCIEGNETDGYMLYNKAKSQYLGRTDAYYGSTTTAYKLALVDDNPGNNPRWTFVYTNSGYRLYSVTDNSHVNRSGSTPHYWTSGITYNSNEVDDALTLYQTNYPYTTILNTAGCVGGYAEANVDAAKAAVSNTEPTTVDNYAAFVTPLGSKLTLTSGNYYRVISAVSDFNKEVAWYYNKAVDADNVVWAKAATTSAHQVNSLFKFTGSGTSWSVYSPNAQASITESEYPVADNPGFNKQSCKLGAEAGTLTLTELGAAQFTLNNYTQTICVTTWGASAYLTADDGLLYNCNYNSIGGASAWYLKPVTSVDISLSAVGEYTYSTLGLPFGVTLPANVKAYILTEENGWAVPTEISEVPAGTGVLLRGTSSSVTSATLIIKADASAGIDISGNKLRPTYVDITGERSAGEYILGNGEDGLGFYQRKSTKKIGANKAYLQLDADIAGVKGLVLNFDDETGVNEVKSEGVNSEKSIFNLAGQRMSRVQKGVNIVNGKKVLVK